MSIEVAAVLPRHGGAVATDSYPVVSVFSGAGGLDLGTEDAGGRIRVAVEPDPHCVETLHTNRRFFPEAAIIDKRIEDVTTDELLETARLRPGEAALLIGGPPCQPFSKSGYWLSDRRRGTADPRAYLVEEYVRVLRGVQPEAFVFENVPSLLHPAHADVFQGILAGARAAGYAVNWWRLHAAEFGVPQTRPRVVVAGLRGSTEPAAPQPSHWWREVDRRPGLRSPETAGRWISELGPGDIEEPEEVVVGRWADHLREIPPGWNYKWHTEWAGHPSPTWITEKMFWTFLLKLSPRRPSWTVQANPGPWTGPFHWDGRRLRTPELAALQTFPTTYRFGGGRRARIRQTGNAVPPLLASKVVATLLTQIAGEPVRRGRKLRYRLSDDHPFDEEAHHRGSHW